MRNLEDVIRDLEKGEPPAPGAGLFGADFHPGQCALVLIPVSWDATASYGKGTALGPAAIVAASHQLDLEDSAFDRPYRAGIAMLPELSEVRDLNGRLSGGDPKDVNEASQWIETKVREDALRHLREGRLVGVVGGEHSVPLGLIKALDEVHEEGFGILHIDAHFDLRPGYEGYEQSHASIMHNALASCRGVKKLVHVGIRDYSREEWMAHEAAKPRSAAFRDGDLGRLAAKGESWDQTVARILRELPHSVYISFDIDGLDPALCPATGTPVPGGLSFREATYLLEALALSGRRIIGFDLCEVAPGEGEWDANVGARILYKMCGATLHSQGRCGLAPGRLDGDLK